MKKIKDFVKQNKDISITFVVLLFLSMLINSGIFLLTLLVEILMLVKWQRDSKNGKEKERFSKREKQLFIGLIFFVFCTMVSCSSSSEYGNSVNELEQSVSKLESERDKLKTTVNRLGEEKQDLKDEIEGLEAKVEEASPWFEMKEEERKAEEERLAKEKAEKEEAERKAKEEAEKKAKEEAEKKEKQGYDTGITYSQLSRTPDDYIGEKVKFSGKVLQVSEGLFSNMIRLGVDGSYDNVLYLTVPTGITEKRILEDDYITIYGVSEGITTYTTVLGASISIPEISVDKVDM